MNRKLSPLDYKTIADLYQDGLTTSKLALMYAVTDVCISKVLKREGVITRNPSLARRKYAINDHAFSKINNDMAYWTGFLMADGSVIDESKIQLVLNKRDAGHIELFRSFLSCENPIYYIESNQSAGIKIHSRQIVDDLATHGVIRRKSIIGTEASKKLRTSFPFWLGLIDGDGSITNTKGNVLKVSCVGPEALMEQYAEFLFKNVTGYTGKLKPTIVGCDSEKIVSVSISGMRASNFLAKAYSRSRYRLERKATKATRYGVNTAFDSSI